MMRLLSSCLLAAVALCVFTPSASAQSLEAHGFADIGVTLFTASESFEAVLGSSTGVVFGGGGGVDVELDTVVAFGVFCARRIIALSTS